ncbi:MAG: ABC transporter permease [Daejeonella sp.]|uniref:ABC transporter permease n=1 Tax=Daejeonella sp. TaxID=2805397 RepID=UPI003C786346
MQGFLLSLQSEFYKTRKTLAFWSAILFPLVLCVLISFGFYSNSSKLIQFSAETQWFRFAGAFIGVMGSLLIPMLVIFQTFSINNIEHSAEMWKSVFSLPIPKWSIYSAKYVYALFLNALCIGLFATFILASGHILNYLNSDFKFNQYDISGLLFKMHLKLFLASLGILSIQFVFSLLWANFLKPMGIGFLLTMFGIITTNLGWKYAYTIPYAHSMVALNNIMQQIMAQNEQREFDLTGKEIYVSLTVTVVAFVAGYFVINKRNIQ